MSPTPTNPLMGAVGEAIAKSNLDAITDALDVLLNALLNALLASDEIMRLLGSHVEPEKLGYEQIDALSSIDGAVLKNVYLAPRRGEEGA